MRLQRIVADNVEIDVPGWREPCLLWPSLSCGSYHLGMEHEFDVVIAGGGLVGSSLAIALDASGLRTALVEANAPRADAQPSYDERNLALSRATTNALEVLGVWPRVVTQAQLIRHVHVSRAGEFGALRFDAAELGVDALGAVLPARALGNGLLAALDTCITLQHLTSSRVRAVEAAADSVRVDLTTPAGDAALRTRLLVGADGTDSFVRDALGIAAETFDYAQTLFVATITPERDLDGLAYERFGDEGPIALLPLAGRRAGLVLSVSSTDATRVATLDDMDFINLAQQRFGWRAGKLMRPGKRNAYPIRRVLASALATSRGVLAGNAAQTIHPIGAQGFNLGLRDAMTLAELLIDAARRGGDPGDAGLLSEYARRRAVDRAGTLDFSDSLVRLACNPLRGLAPLRSFALALVDGLAPLKHAVARHGMGFRGRPTPYALGMRP